MKPTKKISGITGGIGAGKSMVSRILRCNGFPVYDCDYEAGILMNHNPEIIRKIISCAGEESYSEGSLNRKYLASLIFNNPEKRREINQIVHKAVKEDFIRFAEISFSDWIFVESAILFSSKIEELCQDVWIVDAPAQIRIDRVKERSNLDEEEIRKRMDSQESEYLLISEEKRIDIINDGKTSLLDEIMFLLNKKFNTIELCLENC